MRTAGLSSKGLARRLRELSQRRHVWVDCSGGYRRPGLVIAWRRTGDGWEAYVAILQGSDVLVTWERATDLHLVSDDGWSKESSLDRASDEGPLHD